MSSVGSTWTKGRGIRGLAGLVAVATGAAGLMVPLAGVASAATGDKSYDCGKAYGIISRADWSAKFDVATPESVHVNQRYPLALTGSQVVVHSNETSWASGPVTGEVSVPMSFGGVPVTFTGSMPATFSFGAAATVPAQGTATWTAPAAPGDVPVTMQGFSWATNRNGGHTYQCTGTSAPKPYPVTTVVVKSGSRISTDLPAELSLYRGDVRPVAARVQLDGGAVAGTTRITIAGTNTVVTESISSTTVSASNTLALPTDLEPGEYTVTTEFVPADAVHYDPSSSTSTLKVLAPEATSTTLSAPPLVFSDDTTAQVTVKVTGPVDAPAGLPTGKASLRVDGTPLTPTALNAAGEATFTLPKLSVGNHTLTGGFVPANTHRFAASTTGEQTLNVKPPAAQTTVTLELEETEVQSTAKGLARVSVSAGDKLALGTVELKVDGETITRPLVNGLVDIELPALRPNTDGTDKTYEVTATFLSSDPLNFRNSVATPVTLTVVPPAAATTTTINLAHPSVAPGVTNEATVLVQGGTGTPVGTVNLQVNGVEVNKTLVNGMAQITLPSNLPAGQYPVRASFTSSNTNRYRNSFSEATRFTVTSGPAVTTTELQVDRTTATVGSVVTATVAVDSGVGNPAGTVQFTVNGAASGDPVVLGGSGTASTSLRLTEAGSFVIGARFTPSGTQHQPSAATAQTVTVLEAPVTAALTLGAVRDVAATEQATVTATVTQSRGTPSGTVTFAAGGETVTAQVSNGTATAQLPTLAAGDYTLTATYTGPDVSAHATPVAFSVTRTATPPQTQATATATRVSLTPGVVQVGQRARVVAIVSPATTGFVSFNVAGTSVIAPVLGGRASATLPAIGLGSHTVAAQFVPTLSSQFTGSQGSGRLVVVKATTRVTAKATALGKGTVSLAIRVTASATQRLGGRVQVVITPPKKLKKKVKVTKLSATVDGSGVATVTAKKLKKGTYRVKVSYSGTTQAGASVVTTKAKVK